ncbi:hypothetical protein ES708_34331 [subsurface metagenome]
MPQIERNRFPVFIVEIDGIHQLSVDIELKLIIGAVADTDRRRSTVSFEGVAAVDSIHDLQRTVRAKLPGSFLDPAHESLGLVGEA